MKGIIRYFTIRMFLIFCICFSLDFMTTRGIAQDLSENRESNSSESGSPEPSVSESPGERLSDAERIIVLKETIEAEEESLEKLEKELKDRQETFDEVSNTLKNLTSQRKEKEVASQKMQEQDADFDREALKGEIKKLEEEEALVKRRSALALQSL